MICIPAGISAAPGIFQHLMDALFIGILGVYLDDILVSGKTKQEYDNLDQLFKMVRNYTYRLSDY